MDWGTAWTAIISQCIGVLKACCSPLLPWASHVSVIDIARGLWLLSPWDDRRGSLHLMLATDSPSALSLPLPQGVF